MSVINPTVWVFRNLISASGRRFAVRISKNQTYKYGVDNPSDVIYVDDMLFPKDHWGNTGMEEFDEDGDMVPVSFNFAIADQFNFSGVLGDGAPVTLQDLRTENTSLTAWIINDLTTDDSGKFNTIYYFYKEWLNEDLTLDEIYYSGSIDLTQITSVPFYAEKYMTDSQYTLETKKYQTSTISDILNKLYIQDFVENTTQSDMFTATREALYAGYIFTKGRGGFVFPAENSSLILENPVVSSDKNTFRGRLGEVTSATVPPDEIGYLIAGYSRDLNTDLNPFNGNVVFNDRSNVYGVLHGWQFISYTKIIQKVATLGRFVFDGSNSENPFSVYNPSYQYADNTDHYELSKIADGYLPNVLCKNYNILFGVRPDDPLLVLNGGEDLSADLTPDKTRGGILDFRSIISVSGSSPVIIELDSAPDLPLHVGQNIYYYDTPGATGDFGDGTLGNMYINSIIDDTHITLKFGEGNSGHSSGDVVNTGTGSSGTIQWMSPQWYDAFVTPATFSRSETLMTLLVAVCNRFGYLMEWDIKQTGADIGKPVLILRDILNCTVDAPDKWNSEETNPKILTGAETQNINLPKVAIKLNSKGDTTSVYCPRKPKIGEQVIEKEIMTRYKKWGEWNGYTKNNFINDRSKDVYDQYETRYNMGIRYDVNSHHLDIDTNGTGYIIGAGDAYYYSDGAQIYNTRYNSIMFGHSNTDTSGFYVPSYEDHGTDSITDISQVNRDKFNPLIAKAIIMANHYLLNKTTSVRVVRGITDDSGSTRKLLRRQKLHWRDEFGDIVYKRASKIYINEFSDNTIIHLVDSKADDSIYTDLPYVIEDGTPGTGGGISGGGVISGGGGKSKTPVHEELTGVKDEINNTFTIANPADTSLPFIVTNRLQMQQGSGDDKFEYSVVSGVGTIVFGINAIPQTGDYVTVFYYPQ